MAMGALMRLYYESMKTKTKRKDPEDTFEDHSTTLLLFYGTQKV
jgi:hypothetical protein